METKSKIFGEAMPPLAYDPPVVSLSLDEVIAIIRKLPNKRH